MKTITYNPSVLEVKTAEAIVDLHDQLEKKLFGHQIISVKKQLQQDNPAIFIKIKDDDGDQHELVINVIHRPDQF